jgi:hypothetical protein
VARQRAGFVGVMNHENSSDAAAAKRLALCAVATLVTIVATIAAHRLGSWATPVQIALCVAAMLASLIGYRGAAHHTLRDPLRLMWAVQMVCVLISVPNWLDWPG